MMERLTLKKLTTWFKDISLITIDLHISYKNAVRLATEKYENEHQIKSSGFFGHYEYQLYFIMIIQLCKLLDDNKNQKRNFHKLCNCLTYLKYDTDIKQKLKENSEGDYRTWKSREDIEKTVQGIQKKLKELNPIIIKVVSARDSIYAHQDPDSTPVFIPLNEIGQLVDFCAIVYNDTHGQLLNISHEFTTFDWSVDPVLKGLAEQRTDLLKKFKS